MGGIRQFQFHGLRELDQGLNAVKETATKAMEEHAQKLGADAIIGLRLEVIEMSNGVFCVNATGTAVSTMKLPQSVPVFASGPSKDFDFDISFLTARPSLAGSALWH
jgi:hypothetical protein